MFHSTKFSENNEVNQGHIKSINVPSKIKQSMKLQTKQFHEWNEANYRQFGVITLEQCYRRIQSLRLTSAWRSSSSRSRNCCRIRLERHVASSKTSQSARPQIYGNSCWRIESFSSLWAFWNVFQPQRGIFLRTSHLSSWNNGSSSGERYQASLWRGKVAEFWNVVTSTLA